MSANGIAKLVQIAGFGGSAMLLLLGLVIAAVLITMIAWMSIVSRVASKSMRWPAALAWSAVVLVPFLGTAAWALSGKIRRLIAHRKLQRADLAVGTVSITQVPQRSIRQAHAA